MARRQDELVASIRQQRQQLAQELRSIVSLPALEESFRSRPLPWLLGGALVGWAGMRFLARPLWRDRKTLPRRWVRARLRDAVLGLVSAGLRGQRRAVSEEPVARNVVPVAGLPRPQSTSAKRRRPGQLQGDGLGAARR